MNCRGFITNLITLSLNRLPPSLHTIIDLQPHHTIPHSQNYHRIRTQHTTVSRNSEISPNTISPEPSQLSDHPLKLPHGTILGPSNQYRIVQKLGISAVSTVWLVLDTATQTHLAIKAAHSNREATEAVTGELIFNQKLHEKISKENGCSSLDLRVISDFVYVSSSTGKQHICLVLEAMKVNGYQFARSKLPLNVAKRVLRKILLGLEMLHSCGAVHGDLHPGNVLISSRDMGPLGEDEGAIENSLHTGSKEKEKEAKKRNVGPTVLTDNDEIEVKLSDFGSSFWTSNPPTQILTHTAYRSPEVVLKTDGSLTPAIDIWSFGLMAYFLLTSKALFNPWTLEGLSYTIEDVHVSLFVETLGHLPERLAALWDKYDGSFGKNGLFPDQVARRMSDIERALDGNGEAMEFLKRVLVFDGKRRLSAAEILVDPFLTGVE